MNKIHVESGQQFNRWTALSEAPFKNGHRRIVCKCACGTVSEVALQSLRMGHSKSCGCFRTEHNRRHGGWGSPEYRAWACMKNRCLNERHRDWVNYGGRGITVCDRWQDFENFLSDMGRRPSEKHSLDRIDNDRGYSPDNCRWATVQEQRLNQRENYWRRVMKLVALKMGCEENEFERLASLKLSDEELAHHIGKVYAQ